MGCVSLLWRIATTAFLLLTPLSSSTPSSSFMATAFVFGPTTTRITRDTIRRRRQILDKQNQQQQQQQQQNKNNNNNHNNLLSDGFRRSPFISSSSSSSSLSSFLSPDNNDVAPNSFSLDTAPPVLETQQVVYDLLDFFNGINNAMNEQYQAVLTAILDTISNLFQESNQFLQMSDAWIQQELLSLSATASASSSVAPFSAALPLEPFYEQLKQILQQGDNELLQFMVDQPLVASVAVSVVSFGLVSSLLSLTSSSSSNNNNPSMPYPLLSYDPITARQYFDQRWPMALARTAQIGWTSLNFGLSLWIDQVTNKLDDKRADERGLQLAQLLTQLGPTFIKVGQSLSIRTDLLSPSYIRGLATLQDQVPAFDTATALRMLQDEWGVSNLYDTVLQDISSEPIAAASLGQVYKATLRRNNTVVVAIKVQRPDIMEQIALDMYLLREAAPILKTLFQLNTDTVGTVDAWGKGFVDELDYIQEAENAKVFIREIAKTPLKDVVIAPSVIDEYTTRQVLVTTWIDGERLDKSSAKDVTILCSVAMNTYLTMMLEIGLLHSDPHPGNLLRTPDGKLCVLDWGMVTRLDRQLQLTLIEHMAHLTSADYDEIPRDLVLLGFIPASKAKSVVQDSDVVQVLAEIYSAWTKGGGAATINVNRVISQLQDLQATRGKLFQIPPYFAYIAKSFSVLEGIGLSNDPNYSIINECLPYVSKRLLTDKESMGPALSTFLFGPEKSNLETRIVDYKRVEQLVTGFGNYTNSALFSGAALATTPTTTATATMTTTKTTTPSLSSSSSSSPGRTTTTLSNPRRNSSRQKQLFLEAAADQVLDLILTEEETPLQEILLEQLAKIISSTSRSVWTQLRERSGTLPSGRTVLGTLVDPLGLWRTSPLVRMNELDERTVDTTRKLILLIQKQLLVVQESNSKNNNSNNKNSNMLDLSTLSRDEIVELATILVRKVWDRRLGVIKTGNRLAMKLLQLTADKLDKGERDSRKLNSVVAVDNNNDDDNDDEEKASTVMTTATTTTVSTTAASTRSLTASRQSSATAGRRSSPSSSSRSISSSSSSSSLRLQGARQLLEELQLRREQGGEDDFVSVQPVKSKLT